MSALSITLEDAKTVATLAGVFLAAIGLLLNAYATLKNVRSRKLLNYQEIVKSHRELWKLALDKPEKFSRVLDRDADLQKTPLTSEERRFGNLLFVHLSSAFYFSKSSDIVPIKRMREDVDDLMTLPVVNAVWKETSRFFNADFVTFVEKPVDSGLVARLVSRLRKPRPGTEAVESLVAAPKELKCNPVASGSPEGRSNQAIEPTARP